MRRKGEQPVAKAFDHWTPTHPVGHMIRTGSQWFSAWRVFKGYPIERLARASGISVDRIWAIDFGDALTRDELEAFAQLWLISAEDLIASMSSPNLLVARGGREP